MNSRTILQYFSIFLMFCSTQAAGVSTSNGSPTGGELATESQATRIHYLYSFKVPEDIGFKSLSPAA